MNNFKIISFSCLRWKPSKKEALKAKLDISKIREVRTGKRTELFLTSDVARHFPEDISFSIIHSEGKSLDLIADTAAQVHVWVTGEPICPFFNLNAFEKK